MQPTTRPGLPDAKKRLAPHAARNVLFVMIGVGGLVLKGWYSGPASDLIHSYGGNVAASFAVYFWARIATGPVAAWPLAQRARREHRLGSNLPRVLAAGLAVVVVQLFELFDGFGVMTNVYDHFDLVANMAGIAIAFALDASCAAGPRETARDRDDANSPSGGGRTAGARGHTETCGATQSRGQSSR